MFVHPAIVIKEPTGPEFHSPWRFSGLPSECEGRVVTMVALVDDKVLFDNYIVHYGSQLSFKAIKVPTLNQT